MKFPNLSYRIKIPLAISAVILLTEVVVTATLVTRAYADARADLEANARNLTTVLARSLRDPLLRDDLWQAYEVIRTPLAARTADNPLQDIVVLDAQLLVYVASCEVPIGCFCSLGLSLGDWRFSTPTGFSGAQPNEHSQECPTDVCTSNRDGQGRR